MNELEAINHINLMCENCSYWYNGKCHEDGNCFESMQMSINALEKQIPKKMDRYCCPICRHYFEDGEVHNYCPACGQKLENDWG